MRSTAFALSTRAGRISEECRLDEWAESICPSSYLRPVTVDVNLDDADLGILGRGERRRLELPHGLRRAQIGPDKAAGFPHRISLHLDLLHEAALRRLRRHLQDVTFDVHLPAMIEAAQSAFFVASQRQRGAPMRAIFVEHPEAAVAVAEHDQVFAEQPHLHRGAVRFRHLLGSYRPESNGVA